MAQIKLYGNLRRVTGQAAVTVIGDTIGQTLQALFADYPELRAAMLVNGQLRPHIRILIAGRDMELARGLDTLVNEDEIIAIFPPIAGGAH